jgi:hypothetical protein
VKSHPSVIARVGESRESGCDGWKSDEQQEDSRSSLAKGLQARARWCCVRMLGVASAGREWCPCRRV